MANLIMFCIFAVVILVSSMMCVTTTRIMRAATFMLFMLLGVAGLYFLLDYTYLGATQLAVYAGGVTMIFAFAIQLVSKRSLQGTIERIKLSRVAWGGVLCIISCAVVVLVLLNIRDVTDIGGLLRYFRDHLNWNLGVDDFSDIEEFREVVD